MSCPVINFVQLLFQTTTEHLVPFKMYIYLYLKQFQDDFEKKRKIYSVENAIFNRLSWKQTIYIM